VVLVSFLSVASASSAVFVTMAMLGISCGAALLRCDLD
jgi:hypothetical protein